MSTQGNRKKTNPKQISITLQCKCIQAPQGTSGSIQPPNEGSLPALLLPLPLPGATDHPQAATVSLGATSVLMCSSPWWAQPVALLAPKGKFHPLLPFCREGAAQPRILPSWGSSASAPPQIRGVKTQPVGLCPADGTQGCCIQSHLLQEGCWHLCANDSSIGAMPREHPCPARQTGTPSSLCTHPECMQSPGIRKGCSSTQKMQLLPRWCPQAELITGFPSAPLRAFHYLPIKGQTLTNSTYCSHLKL